MRGYRGEEAGTIKNQEAVKPRKGRRKKRHDMGLTTSGMILSCRDGTTRKMEGGSLAKAGGNLAGNEKL